MAKIYNPQNESGVNLVTQSEMEVVQINLSDRITNIEGKLGIGEGDNETLAERLTTLETNLGDKPSYYGVTTVYGKLEDLEGKVQNNLNNINITNNNIGTKPADWIDTTIYGKLVDIEDTIDTTVESINDVKVDIETIENDIKTINNNIGSKPGNFNTTIYRKLEDLEAAVGGSGSDSSLGSRLNALESRVDGVVGNIGTKPNDFNTTIYGKLGEIEGTANTAMVEIADLHSVDDTLSTDLKNLEKEVDNFHDLHIGDRPEDFGDGTTIYSKLVDLDNKINGDDDGLSSAVSSLENRVTTNETNIRTINENIGDKPEDFSKTIYQKLVELESSSSGSSESCSERINEEAATREAADDALDAKITAEIANREAGDTEIIEEYCKGEKEVTTYDSERQFPGITDDTIIKKITSVGFNYNHLFSKEIESITLYIVPINYEDYNDPDITNRRTKRKRRYRKYLFELSYIMAEMGT